MDSTESKHILFSEKFEFAATHKLWNDTFSEQRNLEVFGKCANPAGHGHNYMVEVAVRMVPDEAFSIADFEQVVDDHLLRKIDHKNLNIEIPRFRDTIPTVENIAEYIWDELAGRFARGDLHHITVWETEKTYCTYHQ